MNSIRFKEEICKLIALGTEGSYWDYKEKWHENKGDLLHDIICMANNLENRDAYIIIGVNDNGTVLGVPAESRKNQQNVIDFLKDKKFAGGIRPTVYVQTLDLEHQIDVIIIKNSSNTPYYLAEGFKGVFENNIYTRVGDTNTPKVLTADIDKVEYLWRKRFGLDLSPLEKAKVFLRNPKNWIPIGTDGEHSSIMYNGQYYHKQFPEFTLRYKMCKDRFNEGRIDTVECDMYWMNKLPMPLHSASIYTLNVKYHSTILYSTLAVFADNFRFNRVLWKKSVLFQNTNGESISYCYIERDSIDFMLDNWLCNEQESIPQIKDHSLIDPVEPWVSYPEYTNENPYRVVPVFENEEEHVAFKTYVVNRKHDFLKIVGDDFFNSSCAKCKDPNYINYLCKSGETLVKWLDEWRIKSSTKVFGAH